MRYTVIASSYRWQCAIFVQHGLAWEVALTTMVAYQQFPHVVDVVELIQSEYV